MHWTILPVPHYAQRATVSAREQLCGLSAGVREIAMPRLLLITASSPEIRKVRKARVLNFQQITMPYLASRVPQNWEVIHVDEEAEEIDWNIDVDVVGLTFHTPSAFHAYDIATHFRSRGICVVMGGPHVTLLPEESSQYADVIFIGEAEGLWEEFLKSFEAGSYLCVYQQTSAPSLENIPEARKELFQESATRFSSEI